MMLIEPPGHAWSRRKRVSVEQLSGPPLIPREVGSGLRDCFEKSLELARSQPPDVVLCDVRMPGMTGLEAVRRLRQDLGLRDALLMALRGYGYGQEGHKRRPEEAGFDAHLVKPGALDTLQRAAVPSSVTGLSTHLRRTDAFARPSFSEHRPFKEANTTAGLVELSCD